MPRFIVTLALLVAVPAAIQSVAGFLALPRATAAAGAKSQAIAEIKEFQKGCTARVENRCFLLKRGAELVGQGILISSSPDSIAFFDVVTKQVRVVPRAGTEMVMALSKTQ